MRKVHERESERADRQDHIQVRPWTFFENGVVGHVSMADPFDIPLSKAVYDAISRPGILEGDDVKAHSAGTVICIGK